MRQRTPELARMQQRTPGLARKVLPMRERKIRLQKEDGTGDETTDISEEEVPQGTQDLTDLDEEEVPQANQDLDKEEMEKNLPMVAFVGLGVLAAAALGVLVFVVRKKMKAS